ncbi:MAG TPA: DMT family transporter, partial [Casimicrobiaceae bacterium]|nr:DMT family transporter [Casimicrobiaceae bacterium]
HAGMFSVAALFSLNYIISKLGMRAFNPLVFAYLRVLGAAIVLNLLVWPATQERFSRADRKLVLGFSLLGVVLNQTMFLTGLSFTDAHVAAIIITTIPVLTLGIAMIAGRERATPMKVGGIMLAGAGALLVVGGEGIFGSMRALIGAALITGNCLAYALYLVISKPAMARLSPRLTTARMFLYATAIMLPIAAVPLMRQSWATIPPRAWLALLLVIAGPTVAAYWINAWTLRYAEASTVATYVYVQPVLTAILATIFLGEQIRAIAIVAAAMIFAGVAMTSRR